MATILTLLYNICNDCQTDKYIIACLKEFEKQTMYDMI